MGYDYTASPSNYFTKSLSYSYSNTPLSLYVNDKGYLDLRMYVVPKIILSLYNIVPLYGKLYTYVGALLTPPQVTPSTSLLTNPGITDATFNNIGTPSVAAAPTLLYFSDADQIYYRLPTSYTTTYASSSYPITLARMYYANSALSFSSLLSALGFFTSSGNYDINSNLGSYLLSTQVVDSLFRCAESCYYYSNCNSFVYFSSTGVCKVIKYSLGSSEKYATTSAAYYTVINMRYTYAINNGAPLVTGGTLSLTVTKDSKNFD